jgi:hypothetical protein
VFQKNPFYGYSDESVDEKNRLLLTAVSQQKDNLEISFIFSNLFRMSNLNIYIYTHLKKYLLI